MAEVAVIGLGAMGSRMAARLLQAGHRVTVWNRDPAKAEPLVAAGARAAASPRDAAAGAGFVVAMVRDDAASGRVWLDRETGAQAGMAPDAVAIESSTVTVAWARELAGHFAASGPAFLDAPVAGSRPQAEAGQLIYLVGGDPAALARAEPVLRAMGGTVHHAGPPGSGAAVKLVVNALFGVQAAAMAELLAFARRCGLDSAAALEIVGTTPVCSPAAKAVGGAMLARNFTPAFPVELVAKDLGYVLETARGHGAEVPVTEAVAGVLKRALAAGLGEQNLTGVVQLYD